MSLPSLGSDDVTKIRTLISEAVKVKQEVQDLSEGLRDTIKAVCTEMDIPVSTMNKAITMEFKDNKDEVKTEISDAEDLVEIHRNKSLKGFS